MASPSLVEQVLAGYVTIESARLGGRLTNQPEQQKSTLNNIPQSRNAQAGSPNAKPFYKKPAVIAAGLVVGILLVFAATRKG